MSLNQFSGEGTWEKLSKVAVMGAVHDSRERRPHPKCLQGTRVELLKIIHGLLDNREKSQVIWLHGTAGVGKSAVAFTVAEKMKSLGVTERSPSEKRLGGTFFFSREHTKRRTTGYFFSTLAYQLASNFPSIREEVNCALRENPALLHRNMSLSVQMEALFLRPLRRLRFRLSDCPPLVFVIDALDECTSETLDAKKKKKKQKKQILDKSLAESELADLISLLGQALRESDLPVIHILLTSRSEDHIRKAIQREEMKGVAATISLDGVDVDKDIGIFLQHCFQDLESRHPDFPQLSGDQLTQLAGRAGRRFIVASTMVKFIDERGKDPRDRLQLILKLTSELLPGTEVYKLYDCILSTCADPKRAYLHLSVVAALADPLPILQISKLLGPDEGSDVETTLVQLRSMVDIPTDNNLPVNIHHSSIRDYVSDPSNCGLRQVRNITPPHSLLANSCFRLMIQDIAESTALPDALSELKKQSQAMQSQDPQALTHSLSFIVEPPEPLQVLRGLLWLRGDCSPELQSWLETMDGHAWLQTQGGKDWLQTQEGKDWLQTWSSQEWLQTQSGRKWLQSRRGQDWLQTQEGQDWLQTQRGQDWLQSQSEHDWLQTKSGQEWVRTGTGQEWLQTSFGQEWLQTSFGREWLQTLGGREWLLELLQTMAGQHWLQTGEGRDWLLTQSGTEWLQTRSGRDWLQTRSGRSWLQTRSGRDWLHTWNGKDWLQTPSAKDWLQTRSGISWLRTVGGREWLQTRSGRDWLKRKRGREWLKTPSGRQWLQTRRQPQQRDTTSELDWPQTRGGREWLQAQSGKNWLQTQSGREWLQTPSAREWLQTWSGRHWLQIPSGQDWLQIRDGRDWLQTWSGRDWLQTWSGQEWLQTLGGKEWLQEWLQTLGGREWLQTPSAREWLCTPNGQEWLQFQDGREWLQTRRGREWLDNPSVREWLQPGTERAWLRTPNGRAWLQTQNGRHWLQAESEEEWLKTQSGQDWLQTLGGREWLRTESGRDWLQTQSSRNWLQTPHGKSWQPTSTASAWVTIEEFSSTVEAIREHIIVPDSPLMPALQVIQQFNDLPDFLMFPAFLALWPNEHPTSALPQGCLTPNMEIIHAMKTFVDFAKDARERSQSACDAVSYACQNWAVHLSRAPNPQDDMLHHRFKVFCNRHLLSWLERQWCLKGLRSCLVVLSDGQKLAKDYLQGPVSLRFTRVVCSRVEMSNEMILR